MDPWILMYGAVGAVISVFGFVVTVIVTWSRLTSLFEEKVDSVRNDMNAATACVRAELKSNRKELADYKLAAIDRYASVDHLKEVEGRLVVAIKELSGEIHRLVGRIDKQIKDSANHD